MARDERVLLTQVATCLQDVRQLVCDANAALDQLRALCSPGGLLHCPAAAAENDADLGFSSFEPCTECAQALAEFARWWPPPSLSSTDDGHSPLAVVVTTVRSCGDDPPALNRADRELLQQAFEAFKNTLAPGRSCSTCEPPR